MEGVSAGWEEGFRNRFLARWIEQLRTTAGETRRASTCDMVEEREFTAESSEGTESQPAFTKEQWLQQKSLQWDLREAKKAWDKENFQP